MAGVDAKELLRLDLHAKLLFCVGWAWGGEEGWWRGMLGGGGIWNWGEVLQKEGVTRWKEVHLRNCRVTFHRICHLSFWLKGVIKVRIRTAALAARQPLRQLQLAVIREGCRFRKRSNHRSLGGERGQHWQDKVQLSGYFDTGFKPALCGSSGAWLGNSS